MDPITLYRGATARALDVADGVRSDQLGLPTPCTDWTVQDLLDHLVGGTEYLLAAVSAREPVPPVERTAADYRAGVEAVLVALAAPGALDRMCVSPLGFDWPVSQAVAGTFMDVLVHTWDLAVATGQDARLDPELVDACIARFLPQMPELGRAGGIVGPAIDVDDEAGPQAQLLGAMGRRP